MEDIREEYVEEHVEQEKQDDETITAETDEVLTWIIVLFAEWKTSLECPKLIYLFKLVLTDPESPEQSPAHVVIEQKKEDNQKKAQTRSSGCLIFLHIIF